MLAERAAADYLASADMGGIYRVHGSPTPERLASLNEAPGGLDYPRSRWQRQ